MAMNMPVRLGAGAGAEGGTDLPGCDRGALVRATSPGRDPLSARVVPPGWLLGLAVVGPGVGIFRPGVLWSTASANGSSLGMPDRFMKSRIPSWNSRIDW